MPCSTSRRRAAEGAAFSPACWADDGGPSPAAPGPVPGPAAGRRHGGGLRPVPHPAGAGKAPPAGPAAGPAVLAHGGGGSVRLVSGGLGGPGPAVRRCVLPGGRHAVFLGHQPLAAALGLPGSRSDGRTFGHFDLSAGGGGGHSEKNQKNCKKHLPFRGEMV